MTSLVGNIYSFKSTPKETSTVIRQTDQEVECLHSLGSIYTYTLKDYKDEITSGYLTFIEVNPIYLMHPLNLGEKYPNKALTLDKAPCSCTSYNLFNFGCKCGGI